MEPFHSPEELTFLMKYDSNKFNHWDAATQLAASTILDIAEMFHQGDKAEYNKLYLSGVGHSLTTPVDDPSLLALALQLPAETTLAQEMATVDPDALHNSRQAVKRELANRYQSEFARLYHNNTTSGDYQITSKAIGRRSLKNTALSYLMSLDPIPSDILQICVDQYRQAANMTDTIAALQCIVNLESTIRTELFEDFYVRWRSDTLVMDKWFTLQATSFLPDTLKNVKHLTNDSLFSIENPNKVRSLIGAFCSANHVRFHDKGGEGYSFLGDMIIKLNAFNPQIAARLVTPLINWKRYDKNRQSLMREQLDRIAGQKGLSRGVAEIVNKSR